MSTGAITIPLLAAQAGFRRFSVPEYHKLIEIGVLTEDDELELLEGFLVNKIARNPPHDASLQLSQEALAPRLQSGWRLRVQSAITLPDSEPEPDIAAVRGDSRTYVLRHPRPGDIGLIIEVSDPTLAGDRSDKGRIYARANIPCYWIINLIDRQIEVYTQPSGPVAAPAFGQQATYRAGDQIFLVLDGTSVTIPVTDLLP